MTSHRNTETDPIRPSRCRGFPKSRRIVSGRRFTLLMRRGACAADSTLVLFARPHDHPGSADAVVASRIGITIPKKTGNAVTRNRWKRWIRESFRTQQDVLPVGWDFVVRPKKGAVGAFPPIRKSIPRLARKAVRRFQEARAKGPAKPSGRR